MGSIVLGTLMVAWSCLLLLGPTLAWRSLRRESALSIAGGATVTASVVMAVSHVVGAGGVPTRPSMLGLVAMAALLLVLAVIGHLCSPEREAVLHGTDVVSVGVALGLGVWVTLPPAIELLRAGAAFGVASLGNADIAFYALRAENLTVAGFADSRHVINGSLSAAVTGNGRLGALALVTFVSAGTGLPSWQATLLTMGVAVFLLALALNAFARALWPDRPRAVAMGTVGACLSGLACFNYGHFFLAQTIGIAGIAVALAGATSLALRTDDAPTSRSAVVEIVGGGALVLYAYGHLSGPVFVLLSFWTLVLTFIARRDSGRSVAVATGRCLTGVAGALALGAPAIPAAISMTFAAGQLDSGWPLAPLTSVDALFWPRLPPMSAPIVPTRPALVIGSWILVLFVAGFVLWTTHRRGHTSAAIAAALLTCASTIVVVAASVHYGPENYKTWKLLSYLLPLVLAAVLPALADVKAAGRSVGLALLALLAGVSLLGPAVAWSVPTRVTGADAVKLALDPRITELSRLNLRLTNTWEAMAVAAVVDPAVSFTTRASYFTANGGDAIDASTCTLVRVDDLGPDERRAAVRLNATYAVIPTPAPCA